MFRRRKGADTAVDSDDVASGDADVSELGDDDQVDLDETELDTDDDDSGSSLTPRPNGPWDISEVDDLGDHLDLGSLLIRPDADMELRVDLDEASGQVAGITCVVEGGAVAVQAFAAPRSEGIWDEVRRELRQQITAGGGLLDEVEGPWGTEIRTQVPAELPDGTQGAQPARFVGIDGPRWFLRFVFFGQAAIDREAAAGVESIARSIIVVRDGEARAPGDALPLRLPETPTAATTELTDAEPAWTKGEVSPFERGPEITEIR